MYNKTQIFNNLYTWIVQNQVAMDTKLPTNTLKWGALWKKNPNVVCKGSRINLYNITL